MKRLLFALAPWMVLTAAAHGQTRSADVLYTHFDDIPTPGLRVGDECFVALDDVTRWGWKTSTWADTVDVKAEGKSFAIPFRTFNGKQCLPLMLAIQKLGGIAEWVANTDTLAIYGKVTLISVHDGKLRIESSLDFHPHATTISNPSRLVVDLRGVRLDSGTKLDLDSSAKAVQYKPNVTRLVMEGRSDVDLDRLNGDSTQALESVFRTADAQVAAPTKQAAPPINQETIKPNEVVPPITPVDTPPQVTVPTVLSILVDSENENQLNLRIPIATKGEPVVEKPDASTLRLTLNGVQLTAAPDFKVDSLSVTSVTTSLVGNSTVLTIALARPMGAQLVHAADGIRVRLVKPDVGDGHLAGKIIVVDPGHGGKDRGAHNADVFEKDINLLIGTYIADCLTEAGATVIMTRRTDVFIPLETRAQIANQSHADLFISNHINSTGGSGSQTGTISFHHFGRPICRVLAESIEQEVAKVSGLPNIGVWSDSKIYQSGFSVLRQTKMTGVLLELGFINNTHDRKRMITSDYQHAVAEAVVRGVKVYLGDGK